MGITPGIPICHILINLPHLGNLPHLWRNLPHLPQLWRFILFILDRNTKGIPLLSGDRHPNLTHLPHMLYICHIFLIEKNLPHLPQHLLHMYRFFAELPHMWRFEISHICHIFSKLPHIIYPISGRFCVGEFATYVGDVGDVGDSL